VAWVQQGRVRYFYRSVRRGRRVLHEYYSGVEAQLAAALAEERQRQRLAERRVRRRDQKTWQTAQDPLDELLLVTDLLVRALLLLSGYHQHHCGDWRRRRERNR